MLAIRKPGQELASEAAGLPEHHQAAQTRVPQSAELVFIIISADAPKRQRGQWRPASPHHGWRRPKKNNQGRWRKEANTQITQMRSFRSSHIAAVEYLICLSFI